MATPFFSLRNYNSIKPQPIYVGYCLGVNSQVWKSTGLKVIPKNWDKNKSRIKNVIEVHNRHQINEFLNDLESFIIRYAEQCKLTRKRISKEDLTERINEYFNIKPSKNKSKIEIEKSIPSLRNHKIQYFSEFLDSYIKDCESGLRLSNQGKIVSHGTIKNYKLSLSNLNDFQKHLGFKIRFEDINQTLWKKYTKYLTVNKKYRLNTVGAFQKRMITLLKETIKAKLWHDSDGLLEISKVFKEEVTDVYLNKKELLRIQLLQGLNDREKIIRDLFLIGCYSGFRVSDWIKINDKAIRTTGQGNEYIELINPKASKASTSPLIPEAKAILEKYSYNLPKIPDQEINRSIKDICRLAEINENVTIISTIAGERKSTVVEKWTQVSTHTARRSFATNMYRDGVDIRIIMKATGHTTEKTFLVYLKLDNSEFMDMLADNRKAV
ncbi:tyrosine-type recombinase/integrase [Aquirufa ecclesiirivi]|uniref:site-specific integrase n=1 Tax=Aquirufa ecclesiirivi TaxID=2715124 RepID=UPI003BB0C1E1